MVTNGSSEARQNQSAAIRTTRDHSRMLGREGGLILQSRSQPFVTCLTLGLILANALFAYPGFFEPWGKDAGLKYQPKSVQTEESLSMATRLADALIRFHQEVISPVDGPRSHFRPSSSQYMTQAMHNYGFLKGFIMGCDRLLRENDEEWVYRTILYEGRLLKYDPAQENKYE